MSPLAKCTWCRVARRDSCFCRIAPEFQAMGKSLSIFSAHTYTYILDRGVVFPQAESLKVPSNYCHFAFVAW